MDARFICIADLDNIKLSAVVSSYFSDPDTYLPFFIFPKVSVGFSENFDSSDDEFISLMMGTELAVLINNALARLEGHGYFIFIGLSKEQKSYLYNQFKGLRNPIVEIDNIDEVESKLKEIEIETRSHIHCKEEDVLRALVLSKRQRKALKIDENSEKIAEEDIPSEGIIIVEDNKEIGSVIGINYAFSVNANIKIVDTISDDERMSTLRFIQKWHRGNAENRLQKVLRKAGARIGTIDFTKYKYTTFFTEGLPYSLFIDNCIPCSYVSLGLRPDLFVFNNIVFENINRFHSAVVFSPQFFKDEETNDLVSLFEKKNLHTKALVGKNATVNEFNFHTPHYPYDILHICSHGGEVDGYAVVQTFKDRKGITHTVEYDEVVGFSPVEGTDLVAVSSMVIFKKFNGYIWRSEELSQQKFPRYVYDDMRKTLFSKETKNQNTQRDPKDLVPTSRAIKCSDSIHLGMFQILASHSSPFIFNNTCWSWQEVATFFLAGGAKGYIGTLWAIGNNSAVRGAKTFYENAFDKPIINAFHDALKAIENGSDRNIYIFWGLHFSTLEKAEDIADSKQKVFNELVRSFFAWGKKIGTTKNADIRKNSIEVFNRTHKEIETNFEIENANNLADKMKEAMKDMPQIKREDTRGDEATQSSIDSIENPVEYIKRDAINNR